MPRESILLTLAEVAITLTGFAGIVVFLGRRAAGNWSDADRWRVWSMLNAGFLTLLPLLVWGDGAARRPSANRSMPDRD